MNSSDILKDDSLKNTPLKTNMSPKNQWLEAVLPILPIERLSLFRGHEPLVFGGVSLPGNLEQHYLQTLESHQC